MRTTKELLQLMLDNKHLFELGLCFWANNMHHREHLISTDEYFDLLDYRRENRPSAFSSLNAFIHQSGEFYWKKDDIKPRIKWLRYHIKKNN